jgi:hypothetical protein
MEEGPSMTRITIISRKVRKALEFEALDRGK